MMKAIVNPEKTKHELLHLSVNLGVVVISMGYIHNIAKLSSIGKFWDSLIIPFILLGELLKLGLVYYYGRNDKEALNAKLSLNKKKQYFSAVGFVFSIFIQTGIVLLFAFMCILLGAPVLNDYEQTCTLSIILTLMTVSPLVFLLGACGTLQVWFCEKADNLVPADEVYIHLCKYHAIGAVFGAWIGSVVIPLDWDKEWQNYPIPNVAGAILGAGFSNVYACIRLLYGLWTSLLPILKAKYSQ